MTPRKTPPARPAREGPLPFLTGIALPRRQALAEAGFKTARDLLLWLPRAHLDRSTAVPIADLCVGGDATVLATVKSLHIPRFGRRTAYAEAVLADASGQIKASWFGRYDVRARLAPGTEVLVSGRVVEGAGKRRGLWFVAPDFEETGGEMEGIATGGIVPLYPAVPGASTLTLRRAIRQALDVEGASPPEYVPEAVFTAHPRWPRFPDALRAIHTPASPEQLAAARERFVFEEFLLYELAMALRRAVATRADKAAAIEVSADIDRRIRARLPFKLTGAQDRAWAEFRGDFASGRPMNRLLQGDVGSGKTAVAFAAMLASVAAGGQAALLAPTETLAEQHFRTISAWLAGTKTVSHLLTGRMKAAARREALANLADGSAHIAVGTHALLEPDIAFRNLRVAVVDEQHRFGVLQRGAIAAKGAATHVLVMTATPIPRTLAITAFGDLDVSILDELPPGRTPIKTRAVAVADSQSVWDKVRAEVAAGRQAFVVYPLVDASDKIAANSAIEMHVHLSADIFPELNVGILHGKMSGEEKSDAMRAFRAAETHVLVSTVVIEVGVDVPNATTMIVGNAERFGLAQLHQLRGRIGRSTHASSCFLLVGGEASSDALRRLAILEETQDGFKIAEEDLRLRGPGAFLGTRQSGVPEFHLADIVRDSASLDEARTVAFGLVGKDGAMKKHKGLKEEVVRRLGERMGLGGIL